MIHANDNDLSRPAHVDKLLADLEALNAPAATAKPTKFEVGKTYATRSICDADCWYRFKVVSRTAKTVTLLEHGKTKTCRLSIYDGIEQCKPHGSFSMCCIIRAEDLNRGPK